MPAVSQELQDLHEQLRSFTFDTRGSRTKDDLGNVDGYDIPPAVNGKHTDFYDEHGDWEEDAEDAHRNKETRIAAQYPTRSWSDTGLYYYLPMALGVMIGVAITALPSLLKAHKR
ncbi:hypothetical protein AC578_8735 [Pseudocercospora eumusae]|uniref:Uncharacterized protein n=1 Tax=Pseudocercospora eumusae TaxID=321146 RepID=A0A139HQ12_9PEZI|nr:hypothetical protein AC578_8735 [Pseudocercospora eumusae]